MSLRLPGSRSSNERNGQSPSPSSQAPERQSFPQSSTPSRIVKEGQFPSISVPSISPSAGETPSRLSSTPSLRSTNKTQPGVVPVITPPQYTAVPPMIHLLSPPQQTVVPPMIPVPTTSNSYQQLMADLASLRANNITRTSAQSPSHFNPDNLQWSGPSVQKFYEVKDFLSCNPDFLLPKNQGFALWLQPREKYYSFEVRDQRIERSSTLLPQSPIVVRFPKHLREKTIKYLHKATPSAWYERNSGLIGVQTDSIDQAILTLALIKAYDQGQRLPDEVRKEAERERADSTRLESPVRDALERYIMAEN